MRALTRHRVRIALAAGTLLPLLLAGAAEACVGRCDNEDTGNSSTTSGGAGNNKVMAGVHTHVVVDGGKSSGGSGSSGSGDVTPDGDWTPPACWWEPEWTPDQLKALGDTIDGLFGLLGFPGKPMEAVYGDYNVGKDGMWWAPVKNPTMEGDPAADACTGILWADATTTPKVPMAVSPEIMAKYAYQELPLPALTVHLNPAGRQTVNLPTWIWPEGAQFKPVSVRASLPGTGLWAVTTATPVSLHIDPGTADARTYPASGDCPINADGTIGRPYTPGAEGDPPCGVEYQRMTAPGAVYPLRATLTWRIEWVGSDGNGGPLPAGTLSDTQDVQVREIQTVVR